jgi:hypothetical protein
MITIHNDSTVYGYDSLKAITNSSLYYHKNRILNAVVQYDNVYLCSGIELYNYLYEYCTNNPDKYKIETFKHWRNKIKVSLLPENYYINNHISAMIQLHYDNMGHCL